jgi:hypothetical protein
LIQTLGYADAIRFLLQLNPGEGDYWGLPTTMAVLPHRQSRRPTMVRRSAKLGRGLQTPRSRLRHSTP